MQIFRFIVLFLLLSSSISFAQQPHADQIADITFLRKKQEQAIQSGLTQQDVDTFLKVVESVRKTKDSDPQRWETINKLSPIKQTAALQDLAKLTETEDIFISSMRIHLVLQVTDAEIMAQLKQRYEIIKSKADAVKAQLASLPEAQRKTQERDINFSLNQMNHLMFYPQQGLDVYHANKERIDAGVQLLNDK